MVQTLRLHLLVFFLLMLAATVLAQPCSNPPQIGSLVIQNATCSQPLNGYIIISMQGGNNFLYSWDPPVGLGNSAFALGPGAYDVTITKIGQPQCSLDTTLIVTSTDGPAVMVVDIQPASCGAANGSVTLSPTTLNYTWSNGQSGATATGLAAGCYIATATNNAGCKSVLQVCVPPSNVLSATATVTKPAKCGLPTGAATIAVSGGTGPYTYSLGGTANPTGLAAGPYTSVVSTANGVCSDTVTFTIPPALVSGQVDVTPYDIRCPDSTLGNVVFDVVPGQNFELPFTFSLTDVIGTPYSPGALPAGLYFLEVTDADGCSLPVQTFEITSPPPFVATPAVQGGNCAAGGSIDLNLSGGNGGFIVDWLDMPGFSNPAGRANLPAGYYSARVYDSLFCLYPFNQLYVPVYCSAPTVYTMIVGVGQKDTVCIPPPVGQSTGAVTYSLLPPATSGLSTYGSWVLQPNNGCLEYLAKNTPGFRVDSICIRRQSAVPGFSDTVCVVVTITSAPPQRDSVYFAVQAFSSGTACGAVPPAFTQTTVQLLQNAGSSGTSDVFGQYAVNAQSACLTFFSAGPTGFNIDFIDVGVCDVPLQQCKILTYIPTILSPTDCADGIELPTDTIEAVATDCQIGAEVCVPVPFDQIFDYTITDNGAPYPGTYGPCLGDTVRSYNVALTDAGPFRLDYWAANGDVHQGYFADIFDLVNLVNLFDPVPGWSLENNFQLVGGQEGGNYGLMVFTAVTGNRDTIQPGMSAEALGTRLVFKPGVHTVVFRRLQTGCIDTLIVRVECDDCPPFHAYAPGAGGVITLQTADCDGGAVFCTNIAQDDALNHVIEVDGAAAPPFATCGTTIGLPLAVGMHTVSIHNVQTDCSEEYPVLVTCQSIPGDTTIAFNDDTLTRKNTPVLVPLYANDLINGNFANVNGVAAAALTSVSSLGNAVFDPASGLLNFTPNTDACGTARLTYRITDTQQRSSNGRITIHIVCDRVLVFNGLSPNGDGANDTWQIAGIEQYPKNNVQVFNRWGNLVFEQTGYANERPWEGRWNGRDLPDGTYFYVIDLGDGEEKLSGYLQVQR